MVMKLGLDESPQIDIQCRANEETSVTVYEDEPLIMSVTIVNDAAFYAASYNASFKKEIQELERKFKGEKMEENEYRRAVEDIKGNMLKARIYRFGGPEGWPPLIKFQAKSEDAWKEVDWPLWLLLYHPSTLVAELDGTTSCYVEYGLDPEDPKRSKGEFQIRAIVELGKEEIIESNVITVNLLEEKMPKEKRSKEETLLTRTMYEYKRGLNDDALRRVQTVLKGNPSSLRALSLVGDIESRRGNLAEALSAFEKALDEAYKQYPNRREPPLALIRKIDRIKDLMEQ
jgi:tetratricopeptide (TPR) repeat protein